MEQDLSGVAVNWLSLADRLLSLGGKIADAYRTATGKKKVLQPITDAELGKKPPPLK